jgi:hypothetical protein
MASFVALESRNPAVGSVQQERAEMLPRIIPFMNRSSSRRQHAGRPQTVLQVGRDQELLRLRAKIISCAGYTIQSMTPDQVFAEVQQGPSPRVWVFCHTLDFFEVALLAVAIRNARPADKLLRLNSLNDTGQAPELFDELLDPSTGVDELLGVVASMAQSPPARKTV